MSHKIESTGLPGAVSTPRSVRGSEGASVSALPSAPRQRDDSLRLTDDARLVTDIRQAAAGIGDVDAGRVASLRQAIDNGQYHADASVIAAKLLRVEWQLAAA
ncbi:MAG TPA: flagellar biosynthesis anti-sigma factor FlgM [Solimonas sp.]